MKDYLSILLKKYGPSVAVWRGTELRLLSKHYFKRPILDIGCGDGYFTSQLFKVVDAGIDISSHELKMGKDKHIYNKLDLGDARRMPYKGDSYNTVFSNCVVEHIPNIGEVLSEVHRIMRKKAKFIFTTITPNFSKNLLFRNKSYVNWRNNTYSHENIYSEQKWKSLLKKHNLKFISAQYYISPRTLRFNDICEVNIGKVNINSIIGRLVKYIPNIFLKRYVNLLIKYYTENVGKEGCAILIIAEK